LYRKRLQLEAAALPALPPFGCTQVTASNQGDMKKTMPQLYTTTLYEYLAECVGNVSGKGGFRVQTRGYTHWASRCLSKLVINTCNPMLCFVRCQMRPLMKPGPYTVKMILCKRDKNVADIAQATCQ
jgi:hypothetical protein